MELAGLVDAEAVLTSAGLTTGDISISRLASSGIEDDLILHLIQVLPDYQTILDLGVSLSASPTARNTAIALKNYAKWYCASILAGRPALYKQLASDGKTRNDRFDRMNFAEQKKWIDETKASAWSALVGLGALPPTPVSSGNVFFGKSTPSYNPVTDLEI